MEILQLQDIALTFLNFEQKILYQDYLPVLSKVKGLDLKNIRQICYHSRIFVLQFISDLRILFSKLLILTS